jgi:alkaline phosphatase
LFRTGSVNPVVSRFIVGQKFDLQASVRPDAGQTVTSVVFMVDGKTVATVTPSTGGKTSMVPATAITATSPNAVAASVRGYSNFKPGIRTLTVTATQSDKQTVTATGNFEIVPITWGGVKVKNVIIMLGDGMGSGHRTAARIMQYGVAQGKVKGRLAMDTFLVTANIMTPSLNSIVTDSAPGMQSYVTGNKANNNQEGVFPDDTTANFDNPRVEYLSEFLARAQGKKLGIVTTADVFDATPASMAVHTQNRGAGTGIVDQFFDDRANTGLTVLMGGGRKWFLPNPTTCNGGAAGCGDAGGVAGFNGSARSNRRRLGRGARCPGCGPGSDWRLPGRRLELCLRHGESERGRRKPAAAGPVLPLQHERGSGQARQAPGHFHRGGRLRLPGSADAGRNDRKGAGSARRQQPERLRADG